MLCASILWTFEYMDRITFWWSHLSIYCYLSNRTPLILGWSILQEGTLVERRLHQRKWRWVVHGRPQHQNLTSITPALQDESSETSSISLFFTTSFGSVFEYGIPKQLGQSSHLTMQKTILVPVIDFLLWYMNSLPCFYHTWSSISSIFSFVL